jgi:hypothetical protein
MTETDEEYLYYNHFDSYKPKHLGRRRPVIHEWGDYIIDEQELYLCGLACGEIVLPKVKNKDARKSKLSIGNTSKEKRTGEQK